ncbi:MAG: hypothetical protein V4579_14305 [Pseudomonadota bacterium]
MTVSRTAIQSIAAIVLAAASGSIQRHGPDHAIYCALGKSQEGYDIYCPRPVLNGGWPAPFLFDRTGISVENDLNVPEDDLRAWPLVANCAFYFLLIAVGWRLILAITGNDRVSSPLTGVAIMLIAQETDHGQAD